MINGRNDSGQHMFKISNEAIKFISGRAGSVTIQMVLEPCVGG
jgi:hypothetical protein